MECTDKNNTFHLDKGWGILCTLFILWVLGQVVLVFLYWDFPLHDDAAAYASLALQCLQENTWYPSSSHIHDDFIFAPGYINLLILVGKLTGKLAAIKVVNLFFNVTLALEVYYLAQRLFYRDVARWSLVFYILIYSNFYLVIAPLSDLPFLWCVMTAICGILSRKTSSLIVAGILLAAGNWIRPLAVVFILPLFLYMYRERYRLKEYILPVLFFAVTVFTIGITTERRVGNFTFQSSTSGFNLAMSAFEEANGLVNFNFLKAPHFSGFRAQRDSLNYLEKDRMLRDLSVNWIRENPWKYLRQIPTKLAILYSIDTWPERVLPERGMYDRLSEVLKSKRALLAFAIPQIVKSLMYYFVLFLFSLYLWRARKEYLEKENIFLLIPLLGTLSTLVFVVTDRYHYPFLPFFIIYGAYVFSASTWKYRKKARDQE